MGDILPNQMETSERLMGRPTSSEISHKKPQETVQQDEPNSTEGFDTDFLIFPGDIYPNRKLKLEDADIAAETWKKFEEMCARHPEAFSKNNKDIGRTTLIEMEIDTGVQPTSGTKSLHIAIETSWMGMKGDRNAGKSRSNLTQFIPLGINCYSGP